MLRPILRDVHHRWLLTGGLFLDSMGGGAWPFLFGEVICLVNYFDDRDLSLLNSVQHVFSLRKPLKHVFFFFSFFMFFIFCGQTR